MRECSALPTINVDNPWAAIAAIIIGLGWIVREIQQQRSAKMSNGSNGGVTEAKIRTMVAEHAVNCPAALRLEDEMRALRTSIDNLTNYLLNRRE